MLYTKNYYNISILGDITCSVTQFLMHNFLIVDLQCRSTECRSTRYEKVMHFNFTHGKKNSILRILKYYFSNTHIFLLRED